MEIPEKLRIGNMIYTVELTDKPLILDRKECKGLVDYEFHKISVNNAVQDEQGQKQTFLHEVVHAIVRERNFALDSDDTELVVDEIASGLYQVIIDNPKIFD
jgi:Zn-dependent peptidase ImmA (M78 family)